MTNKVVEPGTHKDHAGTAALGSLLLPVAEDLA